MQFRAGRDCTKSQIDQRRFLPVALTLAQRAFASAESFALAEALMVFFFTDTLPGLAAGLALVLAECTLAQRAFCAAGGSRRPKYRGKILVQSLDLVLKVCRPTQLRGG